MIINVLKVFVPATTTFFIGIILTPFVTHFLYKYKMWKKCAGKVAMDGSATPVFNSLHKDREVGTPKMGGVIIWLSVFASISFFWLASRIFPSGITGKFDLLSRSQTWIPLFALIAGGLVGLVDDFMDVKGSRDNLAGGLSRKKRLFLVGLVALFCGSWFYWKLGVASIGIPFADNFFLGIFFIPLFILVTIAIYSGGVIDGIDGLAGGIFAVIFSAYAGIAFYQEQINIAAFCGVMVGAILAFLWFNIPPARFYMSETGSMSLTLVLSVIAFMTDALVKSSRGGYGVVVLPIIAFPLVATSLSNIIQVLSKKFRNGKKVFRIAPIHHHFEALGWPSYKVTMRYWIIGVIFAVIGLTLALIG